jgi:hypothetical protein
MSCIDFLTLGDKARSRGDFNTALDIYAKGLTIDPNHAELLKSRRLAYEKLRDGVTLSASSPVRSKINKKRRLEGGGDGEAVISTIKSLTASLGAIQDVDPVSVIKSKDESSGRIARAYKDIESRCVNPQVTTSSESGSDDDDDAHAGYASLSTYLNQPDVIKGLATTIMDFEAQQPSEEYLRKLEDQRRLNRQMYDSSLCLSSYSVDSII